MPQRRPAPARRCGTGAPGGVGSGAEGGEAGAAGGGRSRRGDRSESDGDRADNNEGAQAAGPGQGESGLREAGGRLGGQRAAAEPRSDMVLLKE